MVEDGESPTTIGKAGERKGPIGVALGEREILAIGISEAHVALRPIEGRLMPLVMTLAILWKIKEVIFLSIFEAEP